MTTGPQKATDQPIAWIVGDARHAELCDATDLLDGTSELSRFDTVSDALRMPSQNLREPDVIVLAASRPGMFAEGDLVALRRAVPLSGVVFLLGSWCEGETRTGRPVAGVGRHFWYEFPEWWRRQLVLRTAGYCPDWARIDDGGPRTADCEMSAPSLRVGTPPSNGPVLLAMTCRETADVLADVLKDAGFATVWQRAGQPSPECRGASAGIWEGGQLDERETTRLAAFCRRLSEEAMPVMALVDFPRLDRCERAREAGAATVLGKPWINANLIRSLERSIDDAREARRQVVAARAA